jgi:hypothetical protein
MEGSNFATTGGFAANWDRDSLRPIEIGAHL